jgi:hypothetical protein
LGGLKLDTNGGSGLDANQQHGGSWGSKALNLLKRATIKTA